MDIQKHNRSLTWIRRDLRLHDHTALAHATQHSKEVVVVFIFDQTIIQDLPTQDRRLSFIHGSLQEIDQQLQSLGSRLVVAHGDPLVEIPRLTQELQADAVFFNEDYEPAAKKRDEAIRSQLSQIEVSSYPFRDQVLFAGHEIKKKDGTPYVVFTPYKNTWLGLPIDDRLRPQKPGKNFTAVSKLGKKNRLPKLDHLGFQLAEFPMDVHLPGSVHAKKKLRAFASKISRYQEDRDFPFLSGTSGLSVHLRFGTISVRDCFHLARSGRTKGHLTWQSELIWREFYQMILDQFPHVEKTAFREKYRKIKWPGKNQDFKAWCEGRTGFPIVDAAMRQLNHTGWMHNRLRMVVASFLVKDLLVDWRRGEAYFAEKLLDFDLASNNGGWQWSASTGCDAQPYFRIFNPISQSKRFDPKGEFIRKWVPELDLLGDREIHFPENAVLGYPQPIVDHASQRKKALELFKK